MLRNLLWETMGIETLPELSAPSAQPGAAPSTIPGHSRFQESWETFYPRHKDSPQPFYIKTHQPPLDQSPALHVVRDGRKALYSYLHYHQNFVPQVKVSLLDCIMGNVGYGDWSQHYRDWSGHPNRLEIRYEQIREAQPALVQQLAGFFKYEGPTKPWINPFARLHSENPDFYREGQSAWSRPAEWTDAIDAVFWERHGDVMRQLGYKQKQGKAKLFFPVPAFLSRLFR